MCQCFIVYRDRDTVCVSVFVCGLEQTQATLPCGLHTPPTARRGGGRGRGQGSGAGEEGEFVLIATLEVFASLQCS